MKKGSLLILAVPIVLVLALLMPACTRPTSTPISSPTPDKPIELKMAYHHPPQAWTHANALELWAKKIEADSGGRVKITIYPGSTLVPNPEEINALESGLVDIINLVPYITAGRFPLTEFTMLPKLFPSGALAGRITHELLKKYCEKTELKTVKLLWVLPLPPMQLHANKQVQKLEDLKGMKIRSEGSIENMTAEALGATSVVMPPTELFSGLEKGVVNGCFFLWEGILAFGLKDVTKYRAKTDMYTRGFPTIMNLNTWNKLPKDIQEIFERNSTVDFSEKIGDGFDKANAGAMGAVLEFDKKVGNPPIYMFPEAEEARWKAAVKPVWDKWIGEVNKKGLPGGKMVDEAVSLIGKYSK